MFLLPVESGMGVLQEYACISTTLKSSIPAELIIRWQKASEVLQQELDVT